MMKEVMLDLRKDAVGGDDVLLLPEGSRVVLENVIEDPKATAYRKAYEVYRMVDDLFWTCLRKDVRITDVLVPENWPKEVRELVSAVLYPIEVKKSLEQQD